MDAQKGSDLTHNAHCVVEEPIVSFSSELPWENGGGSGGNVPDNGCKKVDPHHKLFVNKRRQNVSRQGAKKSQRER